MRHEEQLAQYLAGVKSKDTKYIHKVRNRITQSVNYFAERGITTPSEADFEALRAWLSMREGKQQGKPISAKTVSEWLSTTRDFYDFVKEAQQLSLFDDEQEGLQEREGLQNEPETPAVNDDTSTVQDEATAILEQPHKEPVNHECEVQCDELQCGSPVNEEEHAPITEDEQPKTQPRRGRRPKNEQERRSVKLSIYLTPKLYEGLKFLASAKGEDISDVVFTQLEDFVLRNSENVNNIRNFFASLGAIK